MGELAFHVARSVTPELALAMGRGAVDLVGEARPAFLVGAELIGDARVLGAYQRADDAFAPGLSQSVLRRTTGGPSAVAGDGIAYLGLAMANASVFMACPRDRVLNRNVRGVLAGLRALGFAAHYFGRETVAVNKAPAALLGWTRWPDERVLLEVFVGIDRSYAPADEERAMAAAPSPRPPIALRTVRDASIDIADLTRACAHAYATMGGHLPAEEIAPPIREPESPAFGGLRWSTAREIPIGWLRAGLSFDERGRIEEAALAGDFYQDADAPARLQAALVGGEAQPERLRDALNATYGTHGAVMEGIRSLQPALEAFLELA